MAILMLGMLIVGWYMNDIATAPFKYELYGYHKATGMLILVLVLIRSVWRVSQPVKGHEGTVWQNRLATAAHLGLYAAMLAMPISGWFMSSAGGHAISFFGLFNVPLLDVAKAYGEWAEEVHEVVASILWGLIGLHVAGALYHHFVKKDSTLKRMLP